MQQPSLEQLNDIVEPGQAGWWPPSWLTIAVVAAVLAGGASYRSVSPLAKIQST